MNEKKIDPFWAGYDAYDAGRDITENPHPREPLQWDRRIEKYLDAHHQWIHGWETAKRDALSGD